MPARRPRTGGRRRTSDRKTLQLCAQVRRTLEGVLTGELDDDVLRMLFVDRVEPAPDASRLMVTVAPLDRSAAPDPAVILAKLGHVVGTLRNEVAHAISRRKVPDLMFQVASLDERQLAAEYDETEFEAAAVDPFDAVPEFD
ncbi:MAG: ribosome-binding factor A [Planctomycetota bacterium]